MTAPQLTGYDLGPLSEIPAGEGRAYDVAGRQLAVFHLRTSEVRVVDGPRGRIAVYYGCADTVTGLAFGYIPEIVKFTKENNIL